MCKTRIWNIHPSLLCTIIGTSIDDREMHRILKRFRIDMRGDTSPLSMHQAIIMQCTEKSQLAEYIEKKLDKQFKPYLNRIREVGEDAALRTIEEGRNVKGVPFTALIWHLLRNSGERSADIGLRVFVATHAIGQRAFRLYDAISSDLPSGSNVWDELWKLNGLVGDLQRANERLKRNLARSKQKLEDLQIELDTLRRERREIRGELQSRESVIEELLARLDEVDGEDVLEEIERLKRENRLLLDEVGRLREELRELREVSHKEERMEARHAEIEREDADDPVSLEGAKVALIGGVEGLMPHYREVVESFGCELCYHGGHCREKDEIERIVEGVDVVFCPVDINSHNACRYAKKACKIRDKPCYFLKSSGLASLKRGLETFAKAVA
ncbi:hypothetical protein FHEFKHOI_01962 [Candidatus Methanoperedenaceae archaeon GB50]|nr:hypothetical protein AIOGIFDO_01946 [Candidatus Methanoperedenaceae archaeon GB37]CAD7776568.1 hypothetical protein FHEFKHOI_01962 [Candidatus Methanoperedenaceae archaeon GB50]